VAICGITYISNLGLLCRAPSIKGGNGGGGEGGGDGRVCYGGEPSGVGWVEGLHGVGESPGRSGWGGHGGRLVDGTASVISPTCVLSNMTMGRCTCIGGPSASDDLGRLQVRV
jgi:hypothetical protein